MWLGQDLTRDTVADLGPPLLPCPENEIVCAPPLEVKHAMQPAFDLMTDPGILCQPQCALLSAKSCYSEV